MVGEGPREGARLQGARKIYGPRIGRQGTPRRGGRWREVAGLSGRVAGTNHKTDEDVHGVAAAHFRAKEAMDGGGPRFGNTSAERPAHCIHFYF